MRNAKSSFWFRSSLVFTSILALFTAADSAHAAKKNRAPKGTIVSSFDLFNVQASVPGKKKKARLTCYNSAAGVKKTTPAGIKFTSYSAKLKFLKRQGKSDTASFRKMTALNKAGRKACKNPDFLSLDPYKGAFGAAEARTLYNRFAFAATLSELDAAVAAGLNPTVAKLSTAVSEPSWDAYEKDLQCDGEIQTNFDGTPNDDNELCDPQDPNDLYDGGIRYGLQSKFWYSRNPFFYKLLFFLHDERMATSHRVLGGEERYALLRHLNVLKQGAFSGNYRQFMRDWNNDYFGHIRWLDGGSNNGASPNENYAREFWELGTVGPNNLDGTPVYSNLDIAQSALAFSGWTTIYNNYYNSLGEQRTWRIGAYAYDRHAPGPKTIFAGTPHQAVVDDADDVLAATFAHPRTAEHLAEDIWHEFINPESKPQAIRALASLIRRHDYNLIPVMQTLMRSKALYAAQNRNSLIKHPVDLVFGFLRQSGYPIWNYWSLDNMLERLGERPLYAPTVFGWDETRLAGEAYVLEWRNAALDLVAWWKDDLTDRGFDMYDQFLTGLPAGVTASQGTIARLAKTFGVTLSATQTQALDNYMNYWANYCNYPQQASQGCQADGFRYDRDLFDAHPQGDYHTKLQGVIAIMLMLPEYRLK